jgi:hypothetical protein
MKDVFGGRGESEFSEKMSIADSDSFLDIVGILVAR